MTSTEKTRTILPGGTLGMIGGGQLGQMFATAAAEMGYRVHVFCGHADEPAARVGTRTFVAPLNDESVASQFAATCDVISLEFENIPVPTLEVCQRHAPTRPGPNVLATAQDRGVEKTTLRDAGLPVTPFQLVADIKAASEFGEAHGWPFILKTCRCGYDGRGQVRVESPAELSDVDFGGVGVDGQPVQWIAERFIPFDLEVSVVVARNPRGDVSTFPMFRNEHRNHILDQTFLPADVSPEMETSGCQIAIAVAEQLELEGVLCVEFFVRGGDLMINEIAPRPHNSGHVTIEACHTSQFQQQVRSVCNLPLGDTHQRVPAAGMLNLLGVDDQMPSPNHWRHWTNTDVYPHWYGKHSCRRGRKMGHLCVTGADVASVRSKLDPLRWSSN